MPVDPSTNSSESTVDERLSIGLWGGEHVRLEVTESGARIEFDCAHGTLKSPLILKSGRFEVDGTFVRERGRVRIDDVDEGVPAHYSGRVDGSELWLSVKLKGHDEGESFTLTRGRESRLFKCK